MSEEKSKSARFAKTAKHVAPPFIDLCNTRLPWRRNGEYASIHSKAMQTTKKAFSKRLRAISIPAGLIVMLSLVPMSPAQEQKDLELNTVLMESTFKVEGQNSQGTAFIIGRPVPDHGQKAAYVLITAAHVLDEMQSVAATLHLRRKTDTGTWARLPIGVPIRANGQPLWKKHPDADVAVMYVSLPREASIPLLTTDFLADDKTLADFEIHPGDELHCLGYPLGMEANDAGFPVLRSGKIASYPLLPTDETKSFLFDFRVFKGNSGGPVYLVDSNRIYGGGAHIGRIHFIIGLVSQESLVQQQVSGPYSAELRQLQLGIAVVVHASLVKQAINLLPSPDTLPN